ncbi:Pre-mRNA-splicing factor clf1 [Diplonema papillatum]|nr:Pre-mRNA-splicing factor clf1 [Diplonema papillatum]WGM49993.1 CRNKL1 [Diplonema papillatum]
MSGGGKGGGKGMAGRPKNKIGADMQITAEQLLLEARDRTEQEPFQPRSKLHDKEELIEYRSKKRSEFEKLCQRNKVLMTNWVKYAKWEENQSEYTRARSVYERSLDAIPNNASLYQKYAEMEMRNENINSARNVWQRAVTHLPRIDSLWMKWALLEETIGDVAMCRQVFNNWMEWKPKHHAWHLFAKFEARFKEVEKARDVLIRMVTLYNDEASWLYLARFEEKHGKVAQARQFYEQSLDALSKDATEQIFVAFARFEERQREFERARKIYQVALDRTTKDAAPGLYQKYVEFEQQYGERQGIEDALIARKRFEYEESLKAFPDSYDTWINYIRMEESAALDDPKRTREVYERAVAQVPKVQEKTYWARYIYIWLMYAQYEELDMEDPDRARNVLRTAIDVVPHKKFSFSKLWIAFAEFEIRQNNWDAMVKLMGHGLGVNPRPKMYRWRIGLAVTLGEVETVESLYTAWLNKDPSNGPAWAAFADFEVKLEEHPRARKIFELGVNQPVLTQPELVWKRYIAMETGLRNYDDARRLYQTLAEKTLHIKIYLSWADMELTKVKSTERARTVYQTADAALSSAPEHHDAWQMMLQEWLNFETEHGTPEDVSAVDIKLHPEKAKKKPSKLLEAWKKRKAAEMES